jgi:hypothetical protein
MGITIHYQWQLKQGTVKQVQELVNHLRNLALELQFVQVDNLVVLKGTESAFKKPSISDPNYWLKMRAIAPQLMVFLTEELPNITCLIGFNTLPTLGCETASFGLATDSINLDSNWCWYAFCKTQYANHPDWGGIDNFIKGHLGIITILDEAERLGINCQVCDESGYHNSRNLKDLKD